MPRPFHRVLLEVALGSAPALPNAGRISLTWAEGCGWGPQQKGAGGQACEGCSSHNLIRPGFSLGGSGGDGGGWGQQALQTPPAARHTRAGLGTCPHTMLLCSAGSSLQDSRHWAGGPAPPPAQVAESWVSRNLQDRAWAGVSRKPELAATWASFQVSPSDPPQMLDRAWRPHHWGQGRGRPGPPPTAPEPGLCESSCGPRARPRGRGSQQPGETAPSTSWFPGPSGERAASQGGPAPERVLRPG